jgi:Tfp pilus assembly PilM family ATPase
VLDQREEFCVARHLAIDWDNQQLRIVAATVRAGKLRIEQAAVWQEEQNLRLTEAEALGRNLQERLKAASIAPAPVLACLGRDRVILREVRYPAVAPGEEPAVIRFQVLKELTDSADDVIIDYTPLGEAGPGEERRALVLTVRREVLAAYQTLCKSAGLKLLALTPRPFGTLACLRASLKKWQGSGAFAEQDPGSTPHAAVALLTTADTWSEFCLVRDDTVLVTRSLPAGPGLAAEVRRNLAVYTAQSSHHAVSALYLAGNGENQALQESLQAALQIPVRSFDPFLDAEATGLPGQNRGAFAGAVGLLRAQATGQPLPINFASPKQPQAARDPNKRRLAFAAGVAAVFLLGLVAYCYSQFAALDSELADLQAKKTELANQMPPPDEIKCFENLSKWTSGNICWLDELYDLAVRMQNPNTILLSKIKGEEVLTTGTKDKAVIQMTLEGVAIHDQVLVKQLVNPMADENFHYVPGPPETRSHSGNDFPGSFPRQFTELISVVKQPPEKYSLRLTPSPGPVVEHRRGVNPIIRGIPAGVPTVEGGSRIAVPEYGSKVQYALPPSPGAGFPARGGVSPYQLNRGYGAVTTPAGVTERYKEYIEERKQPRLLQPDDVPKRSETTGESQRRIVPTVAPAGGKGNTQ